MRHNSQMKCVITDYIVRGGKMLYICKVWDVQIWTDGQLSIFFSTKFPKFNNYLYFSNGFPIVYTHTQTHTHRFTICILDIPWYCQNKSYHFIYNIKSRSNPH